LPANLPVIQPTKFRTCQEGVRMVMDIEDPTYQANRMLNAALLISSGLLHTTD
jgi:hypothetical protein